MASHLSRTARVWGKMLRPSFAPAAATSNSSRMMGSHSVEELQPIKVDIGKREIVGYGQSGEETYFDDMASPFPAIRFKEDVGEVAVSLREMK